MTDMPLAKAIPPAAFVVRHQPGACPAPPASLLHSLEGRSLAPWYVAAAVLVLSHLVVELAVAGIGWLLWYPCGYLPDAPCFNVHSHLPPYMHLPAPRCTAACPQYSVCHCWSQLEPPTSRITFPWQVGVPSWMAVLHPCPVHQLHCRWRCLLISFALPAISMLPHLTLIFFHPSRGCNNICIAFTTDPKP